MSETLVLCPHCQLQHVAGAAHCPSCGPAAGSAHCLACRGTGYAWTPWMERWMRAEGLGSKTECLTPARFRRLGIALEADGLIPADCVTDCPACTPEAAP